jgi:predicted permease
MRLIEDLVQDLRHTFRTLRKEPAFTLIAVSTLALGIGANTAIFTLLDAVAFKPLPVPAPGELMMLYENGPEGRADATGGTGGHLQFSYPRFKQLEGALGTAGSLAAVTRSTPFVTRMPGSGQPGVVQAQLVSGGYFTTLGVSPAQGRFLTPDDEREDQAATAAVVSDGFWKRSLGGTDAVLGQVLTINDVAITIVGVAPPGFVGIWTDREADVWLPLTRQRALGYESNSSSYGRTSERPWHEQDLIAWLNVIARIRPSDRARAIPMLQAANRRGVGTLAATLDDPEERTSMLAHSLAVEPVSRGFSSLRARFSDALFLLAALVGFVLVVTCANIATLLLARATSSARDTGVRISLGATTGRLVRQCLTESGTLALLGGAAGLVLGEWASDFLAHQVLGSSGSLPSVFSADVRVLAFATGASILTAIAFGLAPASQAIRAGRAAALGGNQRQNVGHATMRGMRSLVVGQLALSVVVVVAALLLGRTLINLTSIHPGFSTGQLVTVSFDPLTSGYATEQTPALGERLVAAARSIPEVVSAAASRCGLVTGCVSSTGFRIENAERRQSVSLNQNWVGPGYFATIGVPLVRGREFDGRDTDHGARVAIVNESVVRSFFPGQDPIGRHIASSQVDAEIVGIVRDARTQSLHEPPVPMAYFPVDQKPRARFTALANLDVRVAGDPRRVVPALRDAIRRAEPGLLVLDVAPMARRVERDLARERVVAGLAVSFAVLTLLLASLGLYGVLSYGVTRRTQEIGVRMALGAQSVQVLGMVLRHSAKLSALGIGLGLLTAVAGARLLSGLIFGVSPLDPLSFVLAATVFIVVTAAASWVPAWRAMNVDPVEALRSD